MEETKTRIFGGHEDKNFWSDKPIQKGHPKYFENVVIKLKRKYGKDELVAYLIKDISNKDIAIGQLQSEIEHFKNELKKKEKNKEINKEAKIEARKDELYKIQLDTNKKQREEIKRLRHERNDLIAKNHQLKQEREL